MFCTETFGSAPENPPFTQTRREAPAERRMSELMVSFRGSAAFLYRTHEAAQAEFFNTLPISVTVPGAGRDGQG